MNRRDFFKRAGRLFAALPFIALADLEPEFQEGGVVPVETSIKWMPDGETIHSISLLPWDLEAPKEEVERLSEILAGAEEKSFWQRFLELDPDDYFFRYIWKE